MPISTPPSRRCPDLDQPDLLVIGRLKRKKLALQDQIVRVEDLLTPDIIA